MTSDKVFGMDKKKAELYFSILLICLLVASGMMGKLTDLVLAAIIAVVVIWLYFQGRWK